MNKTPRVLHIIDHMGLGGAQRVLEGLISHSKNEGWFFYSLKKCPQTHNNLFYRNSYWKYDFFSLFELKNLIQNNDIRILHCYLKKAFIFGYLLKILCFPDIILIFHEHGKIEGYLNIWFHNFVWKRVDLFIAVSEATRGRMMKNTNIPENRIKILFNYVNLDRFNPINIKKFDRVSEKKRFEIENADFVVGFTGRIVKGKGWRELLLAFQSLKSKNIQLLIAGTGPEKHHLLDSVRKMNLKPQVKYIGYVDDILQFYCCIDAFIMPSHWEGLPMAALEAQACGIPVLASNVEGLNEIIKDMETGILFEKGSFQDIVENIELIFNDEKLKDRIIAKGIQNAEKFSIIEYLKNLRNLYYELCKNC